MPSWPLPPRRRSGTLDDGRHAARRRRLDGVFACTRKDRLIARTGTPYLALELRDRTGTLAGRASSATPTSWPARFERGDLVRVGRPRRALPRRAPGSSCARSRAPTPARPTRPRSCPSPTATSTSSTASSSTSRARSATPGFRGAARRAARRRPRCAPRCAGTPCTRGGHHAYLGGLLEHTVAVGDARGRDVRPAPAPRPGPAADAPRSSTTSAAPASSRSAPRSALSEEGRLLGHVELGLRMLDERAARDRPRRPAPARAGPLRADAPRRRRRPAAAASRSAEALALYRLNALDAAVKGAIEHGLGLDVARPAARA